jgi:hypothetical protein
MLSISPRAAALCKKMNSPSFTLARNFSAAPKVAETAAAAAPKAQAKQAPVLPYTVPLREMNFVLNEVLNAPAHYAKLNPGESDFTYSILF